MLYFFYGNYMIDFIIVRDSQSGTYKVSKDIFIYIPIFFIPQSGYMWNKSLLFNSYQTSVWECYTLTNKVGIYNKKDGGINYLVNILEVL